MYRLFITAMGVVAAAMVVLGCGSSGSDRAELNKAEFIKQADAVCAVAKEQRATAISRWEKGQSPQDISFTDGLRQIVAPSLRKEAEELEALAASAGNEARIAKIIRRLSDVAKALEKSDSELAARTSIPKYEHEAAAFGFKTCSKI